MAVSMAWEELVESFGVVLAVVSGRIRAKLEVAKGAARQDSQGNWILHG